VGQHSGAYVKTATRVAVFIECEQLTMLLTQAAP
jgi:hypothetical protein